MTPPPGRGLAAPSPVGPRLVAGTTQLAPEFHDLATLRLQLAPKLGGLALGLAGLGARLERAEPRGLERLAGAVAFSHRRHRTDQGADEHEREDRPADRDGNPRTLAHGAHS